METHKNKDWLIQELQSEVKLLQELLENQSKLIGIKDLLLYRCQEKIDNLEYREKHLIWFTERSN